MGVLRGQILRHQSQNCLVLVDDFEGLKMRFVSLIQRFASRIYRSTVLRKATRFTLKVAATTVGRNTDYTHLPRVHLVYRAGNAERRRAESPGGNSQAIIFPPTRVRRPTGVGEFGLGQVPGQGTTVAELTRLRRTDSRLLHGQNQLAEEVQALHDFVSLGGIL